MFVGDMLYLYGDRMHIIHPCGCEADKFRVWMVSDTCGAGQGFIGNFQKHIAGKSSFSIFSCRCVID